MAKTIKAVFGVGECTKVCPQWQYDYNTILQFVGLDLPATYEVDLSNSKTGQSTTVLGDENGCTIPAQYFIPSSSIFAWVYLVGNNYGFTRAQVEIPIHPRAQHTGDPPTPEQQDALDAAIALLNETAEGIPTAIDTALAEAKASGEFDGEPGADGNSIWTATQHPYDISASIAYFHPDQLTGRDGIAPMIGDIVIEAAKTAWEVFDFTALHGYPKVRRIGSIKGEQGIPGLGFPEGGKALAVLRKKTDADYDTEWANPMDLLSNDVKQALLQLAQKVAYIDNQGATYYQALYDALYPPKTVVLITAVFAQGSTVIYDDTALNDLKQYLTVTAKYDDDTTSILPDSAYSLSGLLEAPSSMVTVLYNGVSTTFSVDVTARPTLSSITAAYTQSGTVYTTDTLDSLKADLVVTAVYSDSSTQTVPIADYTLSGTLTAGTSTITVSYGGKTTTFSVIVSDTVSVSWSYTDGLPGDNGLTKTEDGTVTETLEAADLKLTVGGGNGKFVRYSYDYTPTGAVLEARIKTGSAQNFFYVFALKDVFGLRAQVSGNYKGFYLCDDASSISAMTKIADMELNTAYTVRIVLDSGYADVYINGSLISQHVDTSTILSYNTFTGVQFTSASANGNYTGYLYSIDMELSGGN